jgi:hypothetical protein
MAQDHLTTREFDQFRTDDRDWKRQMDERLDVFMETFTQQDKRLTSVEGKYNHQQANASKLSAIVSAVVSAVMHGIPMIYKGGS